MKYSVTDRLNGASSRICVFLTTWQLDGTRQFYFYQDSSDFVDCSAGYLHTKINYPNMKTATVM